jgi:hypothetical protein
MNDDISPNLSTLDFYQSLTFDNPARSLRDRRDRALIDYLPLAERVRQGDHTAHESFKRVAAALIKIERELHGSLPGYFDRLDEVTALIEAILQSENQPSSECGSIGATWSDVAIVDWWTREGYTNGKTARTAFMKLPDTAGMTATFEALWKSRHPDTRRGQRNQQIRNPRPLSDFPGITS